MTKWWQQFAKFLHTANLIPLVVIISTYHYYQALRSHDPMLIAIPMALFVDLLHFRTVQRAVQTKKTMWQLTAVFTTSLAFGLQWMFYSQPGEDGVLLWWQTRVLNMCINLHIFTIENHTVFVSFCLVNSVTRIRGNADKRCFSSAFHRIRVF